MRIEYPHRAVEIRRQRSTLAGIFLQPAAHIYRIASLLQRARKERGKGSALPGIHVVSVGNIEVGGGGKTPFCIYLLDYLHGEGKRPVYISRGYRSESERLRPALTVVLPAQMERCPLLDPGVRYLSRNTAALCDVIGDEGAMVAMRNPQVPMVISGSKTRAMRAAARLFQPSHLILDDAFQSWGVHRDIDVVLLDAARPFGNGRLLPAGTLREDAASLRRADGIGLNGTGDNGGLSRAAHSISHLVGPHCKIFGIARGIRLLTIHGEVVEADRKPVASLSSIARPERFDRLLQRCGCDVRLSLRFPDHFRYRDGDIAAVQRLSRDHKVQRLITTEKDWVKLKGFDWRGLEIIIARLHLTVQPEDFLEIIKKPRAALAASI